MNKQETVRIGVVGVILLTIGLSTAAINLVSDAGSNIQAMLVRAQSPATFDFDAYDKLTRKYIDDDGWVDYRKLKGSSDLQAALDEFARTSPEKLAKQDQLCYWINAYNLLCIKLIADKFPIDNISQVRRDYGTRGFVVGGKVTTAKQIDEDYLMPAVRGNWKVLFTKCPGAIGYPIVANHAYKSATFDADVRKALRHFVLRNDTWYYDDTINKLKLSEWYLANRLDLDNANVVPARLLNAELPPDRRIAEGVRVLYNLVLNERINSKREDGPRDETASATPESAGSD